MKKEKHIKKKNVAKKPILEEPLSLSVVDKEPAKYEFARIFLDLYVVVKLVLYCLRFVFILWLLYFVGIVNFDIITIVHDVLIRLCYSRHVMLKF
jgi:hypothetical protein